MRPQRAGADDTPTDVESGAGGTIRRGRPGRGGAGRDEPAEARGESGHAGARGLHTDRGPCRTSGTWRWRCSTWRCDRPPSTAALLCRDGRGLAGQGLRDLLQETHILDREGVPQLGPDLEHRPQARRPYGWGPPSRPSDRPTTLQVDPPSRLATSVGVCARAASAKGPPPDQTRSGPIGRTEGRVDDELLAVRHVGGDGRIARELLLEQLDGLGQRLLEGGRGLDQRLDVMQDARPDAAPSVVPGPSSRASRRPNSPPCSPRVSPYALLDILNGSARDPPNSWVPSAAAAWALQAHPRPPSTARTSPVV